MKTEISIVSHKNIQFPKMNGYQPIQVGPSKEDFNGYIRDNTFDNISNKNANYCELTAQYWAWKNSNADIKGLVHYRRFFENNIFNFSVKLKKEHIIKENEINKMLENYDLILPKKRHYYIETMYSHYIHSHKKEGLDVTRNVIHKKFPEYIKSYDKVMNQRSAHMFNMMIARSTIFNEYSKWLFDVLKEVENTIDISQWNQSESRIYGYISELLLDVWLDKNSNLQYKELHVGFIGKQYWIKKIYDFFIRKIKMEKKN